MGFEEEGDLAHSNPEEGRLYDGATIEVLQTSNDLADHHSNESSHDTGITKGNSIPSIGDEWSYFSQLDEYNPESGLSDTPIHPVLAIIDEYLDSVSVIGVGEHDEKGRVIIPEKLEDDPTIENPEILDADFVATYPYRSSGGKPVSEGSLDYLFRDDNNDLDVFSETDFDQLPVKRGNQSSKAAWAAQDLHTILHNTSVLDRVQAGRKYIPEQQMATTADLEGTSGSTDMRVGLFHSKGSKLQVMNETELAEYCSPRCTNGGLRHDLHLARTLLQSNQRAKKRIHSLILTGFSDHTVLLRGYNWLNHVLRFNEMKILQWSDIIESKVGFEASDERWKRLSVLTGTN